MNGTSNEAQTNPALLPLTPGMLSDEELQTYDREFSLVFSNPNLRNVAVTGATGSGKSTVVNSWKSMHPEHGWLDVSLANFTDEAKRPSPTAIEEALINQIVGKMDLRKSPKTRFRKSLERPWTTDLCYALIGAAFIALSIFLIWVNTLIPSARPSFPLIGTAVVAWFACIVFAIYRIGRTNALSRVAKRMRVNAEVIELSVGENSSPIQRYMADLVYLLNTSNYDTVVFDDLDSFGYLPLFQELRQLNDLANSRRSSDRARLRFFYLVNDGMFDDPHDRAKFFDYIISIIPYVDPSNALALFREGLEGVGIRADDEFLYELSLFIDDPRILRDLVNETHHYKSALFADDAMHDGDIERLIALLAYKTLFPRDFELLQVDQGYVNALLRSRSIIVEQLTAQNAREAEALSNELDSGTSVRDDEALRMRISEIEAENLEFSRKTLAQLLTGLDDADAVFANPPYVHGLDPAYLAEIIGSPHFPLVKFLIMRGWIDETHERFMSNFYSDSISVRDREFLMAIFQGKPLDTTYVVENPSAVIGRLDADTLTWSNAKNYSLLTYLLHHGPEDKTRAMFAGIRHDQSLEWLLEYSESDQFDNAIFIEMERQLSSPIQQILTSSQFELVRRRRFAHRILISGRSVLENEKVRQAVLDFAQNDLAFLQVEVTKPMNIAEGLSAIGYHPTDIYTDGVSKKLLQYIFENKLYEPTAPFLDSLSAALIDASPAIDSGYLVTRLYNLGDTPIKDVVEENTDTFVETLLENTDRNLTESGDAIAWLLNCKGLSEKLANAYIEAIGNSTQIEDVRTIENPLYQAALLDQGHVSPTSVNMLDYFRASGFIIDEHLGTLLNKCPFPEDLTMGFAENHLGDESGFLTAVITSPYISDEKLVEIVQTYRAQFNHFGVQGLTDSRMELLISLGVVRTTADNLNFVRQSNPHCAKFFAAADSQSYLELVLTGPTSEQEEGEEAPTEHVSCEFIEEEALEIFDLEDVDERTKLTLLANIPGKVHLQANYPNTLNAAIATKHFDPADIGKIADLYIQGDRKLKRALAEAFVEQQLNVPRDTLQLSMDMVADIAWRMRNERPEMLAFIAGQLKGRDPDPTRLEVRTVFERANMREYVELIDGPSAIIPQTPEDDLLIETLGEMGMAGKQSGKADWQGQRRVNSKGYTRR